MGWYLPSWVWEVLDYPRFEQPSFIAWIGTELETLNRYDDLMNLPGHDSQQVQDGRGGDRLLEGTAGIPREAALALILERLVSLPSVSGQETILADAVQEAFESFPLLRVDRLGNTIVARTELGRPHRIVLAGHLDTVPIDANLPPYWLEPGDPNIRPDVARTHPNSRVLWGRGAADMKASDAVLIHLISILDEPVYDLTLVMYDQEEVAAERNGLGRVLAVHPDWVQGDFAIIGEPTNCGIEAGCNGTIRFDLITHGVSAHSARAWMGRNAIHAAAPILERLDSYQPATVPVDGLNYREGLNATMISGGLGTNVIPDTCRVHVNYRFAPDKTVAQAKALMMGADTGAELGNGEHRASGGVFQGFDIEMRDESPSANPGLSSSWAQSLIDLVARVNGSSPSPKLGWTDVARFSALGIPAVNLGAGDPLLAHTADEQVPLDDLISMELILASWLNKRK